MNLSDIPKIINTISHYKKEQLGWYIYYRTRKVIPIRLWFRAGSPPCLKADTQSIKRYLRYAKLWSEVEKDILPRAESVLKGTIEYAGENVSLENLLRIKETSISPLAMYGIHSFEFLWHLCLAYFQSSNTKYADFAKLWVMKWIEANPIGTIPAWDAYPTAYRIQYWVLASCLWKWTDKEIQNSLAIQTKWLSKSIEYHLKANHVIQNLTGLIVSSATFFPEMLTEFLSKLEEEIKEQILEDGGHHERCPMYHLHVLLDLLVIMAVLKNPPAYLKEAIVKMVSYLRGITFSNGEYPLFGDSVYGHLPEPNHVIQIAEQFGISPTPFTAGKTSLAYPETGYYIIRSRDNQPAVELIIRAGEPGPSYQLAHAHCDQLSYELSINKQRIVVDSGIHGYGGSPYRDFQRSTRAHNVVYLHGEEQLEYWGTFRVARRGMAKVLLWEPYNQGFLFVGRYAYYSGSVHTRMFYIIPSQGMLCWDWMETKKSVAVENLIHLHPSLETQFANSYITIYHNNLLLNIYPIGHETIEVLSGLQEPMQGWYSDQFGKVIPNSVLVLKRNVSERKLAMGYWISFIPKETDYPKGDIQQWVDEIGKKINL